MDKVEPVAVSLPPATCRLPVRLPEHLCLVGHRVLLPDGVAEHGAEIRTSGAADSLYLPITLHKYTRVNWDTWGDLVAWALAVHQVPIIPS